MGYYANGSGSITFKRALTEEESDKIDEILSEYYDCDGVESCTWQSGKGYFDIWDYDKYDEYEAYNALVDASKIAPVECGEIDYVGEDGANWRFIYRDGEWIEQSGRVVYDEQEETDKEWFGVVRWCREDITAALRDYHGIDDASDNLIDEIVTACKNNKFFTDHMIEAGWESINDMLSNVLREADVFNA